jgi:hypothetical protein
MKCPHCSSITSGSLPYSRALEGGVAYAQVCPSCGHILGLRPWLASDPPVAGQDFSSREIARLQFVRWRLSAEIQARTHDGTLAA